MNQQTIENLHALKGIAREQTEDENKHYQWVVEQSTKAELIAYINLLEADTANRSAAMVQMADALQSALNLGQLVHFARVNTPQVGKDEGEYELEKIRTAINEVSKSFPMLFA